MVFVMFAAIAGVTLFSVLWLTTRLGHYRAPSSRVRLGRIGLQLLAHKLNAFNGNYIQAERVKAFIESMEDRQRFGTP